MDVKFESWSPNDYNYSLIFTINGKTIEAGYNNDENNTISIFSYSKDYDEASQERRRRFFYNFKSVLEYCN